MSELDKAHDAWLKERDALLKRISSIFDMHVSQEVKEIAYDAIVFIMGSNM